MSQELAVLFYDQCVGEHNGHMAKIPNNPLFKSIFAAAGYNGGEASFAKTLRKFADDLEKVKPSQPF